MKKKIYRQNIESWYLERIVFLVAGIFILVSLSLFLAYDFHFALYFAMFVGAMLINFAFSGYCPMAIILDKLRVKGK